VCEVTLSVTILGTGVRFKPVKPLNELETALARLFILTTVATRNRNGQNKEAIYSGQWG